MLHPVWCATGPKTACLCNVKCFFIFLYVCRQCISPVIYYLFSAACSHRFASGHTAMQCGRIDGWRVTAVSSTCTVFVTFQDWYQYIVCLFFHSTRSPGKKTIDWFFQANFYLILWTNWYWYLAKKSIVVGRWSGHSENIFGVFITLSEWEVTTNYLCALSKSYFFKKYVAWLTINQEDFDMNVFFVVVFSAACLQWCSGKLNPVTGCSISMLVRFWPVLSLGWRSGLLASWCIMVSCSYQCLFVLGPCFFSLFSLSGSFTDSVIERSLSWLAMANHG